jgi:UDP-4-amino-4,6-dideoxy-N-acetyl-beta-L-altrosamine N-acetyltransferase
MWIFKSYRNLSKAEHIQLLSIRNEQKIKEASSISNTISLEEHLKWLKSLSLEQNYFALFIDDEIVGGVNYFAKKNKVLKWGIFFSQDTKPFIASLVTYIFIEFMFKKYFVLYSEVLKTNTQAIKFNTYFGLSIRKEDLKYYHLELFKESWQEHKSNLKVVKKRLDLIKYKFI